MCRLSADHSGNPVKCPYCQYLEDRVLDSRVTREGEAIKRRRECLRCNRRFTTYEQAEERRGGGGGKSRRRRAHAGRARGKNRVSGAAWGEGGVAPPQSRGKRGVRSFRRPPCLHQRSHLQTQIRQRTMAVTEDRIGAVSILGEKTS